MRKEKYLRQYERYDYLKKIHICVNCGNEDAEPNSIYCLDCKEKIYSRNRRYRKNNEEKMKNKEKEYFKNLYHKRKKQGICTKCGKRKVCRNSITLCLDCYIKHKRIKDKRWNNEIPRSERKYYDLCYVCGKEKIYKSNLCKKHYDILRNKMISLNANPTPAMIKHREEYKNYFNLIFSSRRKYGKQSNS